MRPRQWRTGLARGRLACVGVEVIGVEVTAWGNAVSLESCAEISNSGRSHFVRYGFSLFFSRFSLLLSPARVAATLDVIVTSKEEQRDNGNNKQTNQCSRIAVSRLRSNPLSLLHIYYLLFSFALVLFLSISLGLSPFLSPFLFLTPPSTRRESAVYGR